MSRRIDDQPGSKTARRAADAVPSYQAPALDKGLDILELLAGEQGSLSQQQIAARLGRTASEIFRMLETLERRGYLMRTGRDGAYALTLRLFELAHRQGPVNRLLAAALPVMHALARDTRQSNHLVVHHDRRILVIASVASPEAMGFSVRQGAHFAFHADRVSSRVLTAFQTPARRAELLDEMLADDPDAPARATLTRRVDAIRRRGFEAQRSDTLPGITDICFPIVDHDGHAIATLTQPYLKQRYVAVTLEQACALHGQAVARISAAFGAPA